jgi:hypothetical protein
VDGTHDSAEGNLGVVVATSGWLRWVAPSELGGKYRYTSKHLQVLNGEECHGSHQDLQQRCDPRLS